MESSRFQIDLLMAHEHDRLLTRAALCRSEQSRDREGAVGGFMESSMNLAAC